MYRFIAALGFAVVAAAAAAVPAVLAQAQSTDKNPEESTDLLAEVKSYPHKIVYESNRDGNFDLFICNADGSNPVNLTNTADVDELYPKPSPDGTKICFVADEGKGEGKSRNVYFMNTDGTGRVKVADNAREPCWSGDGTQIAFLKGEFEKFNLTDFATTGIFHF
jgi:Tol biopolymer transport system component